VLVHIEANETVGTWFHVRHSSLLLSKGLVDLTSRPGTSVFGAVPHTQTRA
jgi:hypothetical protein